MSVPNNPSGAAGRRYKLPSLESGLVVAAALYLDAAKSLVKIEEYIPATGETIPIPVHKMVYLAISYHGYSAGNEIPEGETVGVILNVPFESSPT